MSRPTPRRPASSRGSTPRPRKIAGRTGTDAPDATPTEQPIQQAKKQPIEEPAKRPTKQSGTATKVQLTKRATLAGHTPTVRPPDVHDDRPGVLARQKTTRVLIATLALVALASVAQFAILLVDRISDDDGPTKAAADGALSVPDGRPVVADQIAWLDGVEKAAKAAQEIVAVDYKTYDDEVDKAAELMTSDFERQYRTTAADIEKEFVANKTAVQATVVAQGVRRANRTRLEALIFLNQVVSREREGKPETVVTPYKVLVTMVHTDQGWFVDDLDTDAPKDDAAGQQDKTN